MFARRRRRSSNCLFDPDVTSIDRILIAELARRAAPFCAAVLLLVGGCLGSKDARKEVPSLTGVILVTGNEPFTNLSLQTTDGRMFIIQRDTTVLYSSLNQLQGKKVCVRYLWSDARPDSTMIIVERYDLVLDR